MYMGNNGAQVCITVTYVNNAYSAHCCALKSLIMSAVVFHQKDYVKYLQYIYINKGSPYSTVITQ